VPSQCRGSSGGAALGRARAAGCGRWQGRPAPGRSCAGMGDYLRRGAPRGGSGAGRPRALGLHRRPPPPRAGRSGGGRRASRVPLPPCAAASVGPRCALRGRPQLPGRLLRSLAVRAVPAARGPAIGGRSGGCFCPPVFTPPATPAA
jgi:hypothetical protein